MELAEIERFLDAASDAFAALVLEGEAGIGKTTLWLQARRRAEARGAAVLWCRPAAPEASLSFAAVHDLLAPLGQEPLSALPGPQREALEIALLTRDPGGRGPMPRAVAAGFLGVLRGLAATRPVVLAVDDWQWLDVSSRRVLEFAARRLEAERVGLLCAIRSPVAGQPIGGAVADERLRSLALAPLSLAALGRIVAERLGRTLPRPWLVRIADATAGNPFYALEIARALTTQDLTGAAPRLPVPDDLRKLTLSRIRQLPPHARDALLLAAVMSSPDAHSVDVAALELAEQAGLVEVDDTGRVGFVHPLFAAAAYDSVPRAQRRELHRLAADRVTDPEQRARHMALAAATGDRAVADALDEASRHAASRGAPDAAAELAELAAQLSPSDARGVRERRLLRAGQLHFAAGDLTRADALAGEVIDSAAAPGLRAQACQLAAQLCGRQSNFGSAAAIAARALALAGDDARLLAAIELDLVYCAVSLGDIQGAESHARAAIDHALAAGESGMVADALAVLTMAGFLAGQGIDQEQLQRALALEDPLMERSIMMRPGVIHALLQLWSADVEAALRALTAIHDEALERGQESVAPMLSLYRIWAAVWLGRLDQAARWSEQALAAAALLDDPTTSAMALAASALVHAHDGRTGQAREEATESLALFEALQWRSGMIWPLWALGFAELSDDRPEAVDATLGPLAGQVEAMGAGDPVLALFVPDEIEALVALGQLERADAYLAPFERRAQALDRAWALAAAERCRGVLFAAAGEPELAFAAFARALTAHARTAMPLERARTLLLAGQAYRRYKRRGEARALLEEAATLFERAGAPAWLARARRELARIGRPAPGADELTETERRVAELAASGLSNQEIAERAFVSVKTVEANLTRAYRKLGVRSRAGLAGVLGAGNAPPASRRA